MKLAFLILAHTDIDQLKRLCNKLVDYGHLYIHVDKKAGTDYYNQLINYIEQNGLNNDVTILKDRVNVWWGGYSMIDALEKLLLTALNDNQSKYDRLFLLSGLCYPLFSPSRLMNYCKENNNKELLTAYNITQGNSKGQKQRIILYHYFRDINLPFKSIIRKGLLAGTRIILKYCQLRKKPYLFINGTRWDIYSSSQMISLTNGCWKYVLDQLLHNKKLVRYFKTSYAPDEMIVPTIIMNSEYKQFAFESTVSGSENLSMLHYLKYRGYTWTYAEKDYEVLIRSNRPFVRKLVSGKSEKLIEMINNYHKQEIV